MGVVGHGCWTEPKRPNAGGFRYVRLLSVLFCAARAPPPPPPCGVFFPCRVLCCVWRRRLPPTPLHRYTDVFCLLQSLMEMFAVDQKLNASLATPLDPIDDLDLLAGE